MGYMRSIYNIYEGILGNVDDVLAGGEDAIAQKLILILSPQLKISKRVYIITNGTRLCGTVLTLLKISFKIS